MIIVHPLRDIGEVAPGDDLASLLAQAVNHAGLAVQTHDILVVSQKILSKAQGRFVELGSVKPGARALELAETTGKDARLVELVLQESAAVVRAAPNVLITRHLSGHVMANAGIDHSNIGPGGSDRVLLLPEEPDRSAQELRDALARIWPTAPAVLISDSFGRPWRMGVTNVALGAAGFPALLDRRGDFDREGRQLEVTQIALGDLVASAAGLAMGEAAEGIPAALVSGLSWSSPERPASALLRPAAEDLFR